MGKRELGRAFSPVARQVEEVKVRELFGSDVVWLDGEWQTVKAGGTKEGRTELFNPAREPIFDGPCDELVLRRVVPQPDEAEVEQAAKAVEAVLERAYREAEWEHDAGRPDVSPDLDARALARAALRAARESNR